MCTAFCLWKGLACYTDSPSPIVVVLSGSMEPVFHRGDLLVLSNRKKAVDVGDVVVYNVKGRDIPIVHRVIKQHWTSKDMPPERRTNFCLQRATIIQPTTLNCMHVAKRISIARRRSLALWKRSFPSSLQSNVSIGLSPTLGW